MAIKTKTDLNAVVDDMSAQELRSVIEYAQSKLNEKMEGAKQSLITEMREKAGELGLSYEELFPASHHTEHKQGKKRGPAAIIYRGPNSETWTGRGRTPGWLKALEDLGRKREEFRV